MRYYLYEDREAIKNIYGGIEEASLSLQTIEYIDQRCDINTENGFFEAKIHEGIKNGGKIEGGIDGANSRSITKIRAYGNLEDIKSIHQNKFYHNLILEIKKIWDSENECRTNGSKIYFNKGRIIPYSSRINREDLVYNQNLDNKSNEFALMGSTYLWLGNDNNNLKDIGLIWNITDEVNVLAYSIKDATRSSPQVVKVLAIYIE